MQHWLVEGRTAVTDSYQKHFWFCRVTRGDPLKGITINYCLFASSILSLTKMSRDFVESGVRFGRTDFESSRGMHHVWAIGFVYHIRQ